MCWKNLYISGIKARDISVRNTYLVCRMFWCDDAVRSNVCWGTFNPTFVFSQVRNFYALQIKLDECFI